MKTDYDVVICGGGLAGLITAILFAQYGFKTLCIDGQKAEDVLAAKYDGRTTAISYGSKLLLESADLWKDLEKHACPIKDIHIRDSKTPTLLTFLSDDVEGKNFGWIVENLTLRQHLIKTAQNTKNLDYKDGVSAKDFVFGDEAATIILQDSQQIKTNFLVGADGRNSSVRQALDIACKKWSYDQSAIVFNAYHTKPHNNIAVEHFRSEGPFAILPMTDDEDGTYRSSVVWTEHGNSEFLNADESVFLAAVQTRFGEYFGEVKKTGQRFSYPLSYMHADSYVRKRTVLVAEAAHAMHPIAGQGLNMSLRDVAAIVELCTEAKSKGEDYASQEILKRYEEWRKKDNRNMGIATDSLNRLFSNKIPAVKFLRNAGLEIVRNTPFAKQFFMRQAMGQMGDLPKLIKGEKLA